MEMAYKWEMMQKRQRHRVAKSARRDAKPIYNNPTQANFLPRQQAWMNKVKYKRQELKSQVFLAREIEQMQECSFKPNVIGHQYDNSGLSNDAKAFYAS